MRFQFNFGIRPKNSALKRIGCEVVAIGCDFVLPYLFTMDEPYIFHMDDLLIPRQAHEFVRSEHTVLASRKVAGNSKFVRLQSEGLRYAADFSHGAGNPLRLFEGREAEPLLDDGVLLDGSGFLVAVSALNSERDCATMWQVPP